MISHFTIAGQQFSAYWTVFVLGIVGMVIMNLIRCRKSEYTYIQSVVITLLSVVISFVGAKMLYYIENPKKLIEYGFEMDGVSFFGSLFLVPIVMWCVCKLGKKSWMKMMDFISPSLMLMLAVLRLGCWISGCCGGIAGTFGGVYMSHFPTQITECVCDILILLGLLFYEKFWDREGRLYFFIMVYYGIVRFLIEFVRDTSKDWLYMSHGQWFAMISVIIGGYMLQKFGKIEKKSLKSNQKRKSKKKR